MDKPITEAKARAKELTRAVIGLLGARTATPLTMGGVVAEIMTRNVRSCRVSECLDSVAKVMWEHDCGMVPVTDHEERVVGVLTDRDLCMAAFTQGCSLHQIDVASVISGRVYSCQESDSLDQLVALMRENAIRRVPVVDAEQRLCAIVSLADLAGYIASRPEPAGHAREILTSLLARLSSFR